MRRIAAGVVALLWAGVALAARPLRFAPPAAWVVPQAVPSAIKPTGAAVQFLLADRQVELTAKAVNYYVENAIRIQTPQGLSALGTITLTWNPDTDRVIVHKIDLIRDGKAINLLANGRRFTIAKRESNLEAATLDDTLTAILQPPGLRVGDIVDVAYTLVRRQPLLAGTPSAEVQVPWALPVSRLHIRALWSPSLPIRWQEGQGLAAAHPITSGGERGISLTMRNVPPVLQPRLAPLRFLVDRRVDFTAFRSWAQLAQRLAPLYRNAARLRPHSPLLARVARIRAASADPRRQAALALRLVESQVRYLFLDFDDGGLKPAPADLTWSRRFGDCKAKTVLLLALLHGLGIQAEPVAVNIAAGDVIQGRLPMIQLFNHVLVRAVIAGRAYWLDGTRLGDRSLAQLRVPYYHWGLPLIGHDAQLLSMVPRPPRRPTSDTRIDIDASAGILRPAPFRAQMSLRGDAGLFIEQRLANLTPDQLDEALRHYWAQRFGFVHATTVSAHYDRKRHAERFLMSGTARLRWQDHDYLTDGLGVGFQADFSRAPGPARDAPYAVAYPFYTRTSETIRLPQAGKQFSIVGADVDRTVAGIHYERHASIQAGVFHAVASGRSVAREVPAQEAAHDQKILRRLSQSNLYLRAPADMVTRRVNAKRAEQRAIALLGRGDPLAAIAALDQAIAIEGPRSALLVSRAQAEIEAGNVTMAGSDVAAVHSSRRRVAAESDLAAGLIAFEGGRMRAAIRSLSAALTLKSTLRLARLLGRQAYLRRGEYQRAAADVAAQIRVTPPGPLLLQLYWMRAGQGARC